jgi:hypothetical protein
VEAQKSTILVTPIRLMKSIPTQTVLVFVKKKPRPLTTLNAYGKNLDQ